MATSVDRRAEELFAIPLGNKNAVEICNELDSVYGSGGTHSVTPRLEKLLRKIFGEEKAREVESLLATSFNTGGLGITDERIERLFYGVIGSGAVELCGLLSSAYGVSVPAEQFRLPLRSTLTDISGNGYDAAVVGNTPTYDANGGINLNGQYLTVPTTVTGVSPGWTLSCSFKRSTYATGGLVGQFIDLGRPYNAAGSIHYYNDSVWGAASGDLLLSGPANDELWHHAALALVASTGSLTLYIDGVQVQESIADFSTSCANSAGHNVMIGADPGTPDEFFVGIIKNVRGWRTPLIATQVACIKARDI